MASKRRVISFGGVLIGGDNPCLVQSMTNTDTRNAEATYQQILELEKNGCEIIRVAVPDEEAALAIKNIKNKIHIPLIADIHFDYHLAILSLENGADCIRINPGNIGGDDKLKKTVDAAKSAGAAIRIGVNSGSLEKDILKSTGISAESLAKSAVINARKLEEYGFDNFKVSIKSSSVPMTIKAYGLFAKENDAPLHIGVTEAGTEFAGTIKSSIGIGALLASGIGDTLRVSLTGDPVTEVTVGWQILSALELRRRGPEIISCPTCGRTEIDLVGLANDVEKMLATSKSIITVAVMGCPVNGPGEAREADYGIAGGKGLGIIFRKGEVIKKVKETELLEEFKKILEKDCIIK